MDVTATVKPADRAGWRAWLAANHATEREIWLLLDGRPEYPGVSYLDAVEEALCFGWIDSTQKRHSEHERAQRFSPRRRRSRWTELNKERARRLIRLGLMTDAGQAVLPDLDAPFVYPEDILDAIRADRPAWAAYQALPELYRRIRISAIEDVRADPVEHERRLARFMESTARGRMFGEWDDGGRLG